ncbi:Cytoplasmic glyoxalase II [Coemansia sp. RSA 1813]|nr:Cytoplasmic glyoxalase II [Coemansia sp. RSA 1646]KAJ1771962.1 Cytoplasmic glyoxalase II [Coemansia sp. RSA 1843]KAJ2089735.1 Cytoplasmic glyoxalase II [Coemansia sp. RSA 986]KAJ2214261.1 Cytoplasmic glyoxalase II [Coemansia sp. RSA 487]KAJ2569679.1 Cytoplasmic glyoxalase II [Coemansia sp. RSA 1813]
MKVIPVPCLSDNYAYVLVDEKAGYVSVIDPVEPSKVIPVVESTNLELKSILTTHHHADHSGGNNGMLKAFPGLTVYGGDRARIPGLTKQLNDGDEFKLGSLSIRAIQTFGHTTSSICYYIQDSDDKVVFSGDTLFVGGCGRLFEGTPQDMHTSLNKKLAALPKDTKVYAGHEYTRNNLRFALTVEPNNKTLKEKAQRCEAAQCTMPSTIGEELATNPFMRVDQPDIQKATGATDPVEVLAVVRRMKDNF